MSHELLEQVRCPQCRGNGLEVIGDPPRELTCPTCAAQVKPGDLICFTCGSNLPRASSWDDDQPAPATIMQEYLTTTSVGDLIRKARGTQELPKGASSALDVGFQPATQSHAGKGRDLS